MTTTRNITFICIPCKSDVIRSMVLLKGPLKRFLHSLFYVFCPPQEASFSLNNYSSSVDIGQREFNMRYKHNSRVLQNDKCWQVVLLMDTESHTNSNISMWQWLTSLWHSSPQLPEVSRREQIRERSTKHFGGVILSVDLFLNGTFH